MAFDHSYQDWNHKRCKTIIDYYGSKFFYGKKVLDLGAGQGEVAASLARLGADVLCVDARAANLAIINKKHPYLKTQQVDLDKEFPFNYTFDLTLSLGLMCHLKDYEKHIENICVVSEFIILETEVLDSADSKLKLSIFEDRVVDDLSFNGEGCIVNAAAIQNKLSELGSTFRRVDETRINSGNYRYDWFENNQNVRRFGNRRLWFIRRDKFITQKLHNQEQIKKAEANIIRQPEIKELKPMIEVASVSKSFIPTAIKNVAICLFGDCDLDKMSKIKKEITSPLNADVFLHSFNRDQDYIAEVDKILSPIKYIVEDKQEGYPTEQQVIKSLIASKKNFEERSSNVYDRVVTLDMSCNVRSIDTTVLDNIIHIHKLNDKIQYIYSDSFIFDIIENIKPNENGLYDSISECMKEYGIRINPELFYQD